MTSLDFILGSSRAWEMARVGPDAVFALYRKRIAMLRDWELFGKETSVLDIGCGQYANIIRGAYLGIDNSARYIAYAQAHHNGANRAFRCMGAAELDAGAKFDVVLMADVLHHFERTVCCKLIRRIASVGAPSHCMFRARYRAIDPPWALVRPPRSRKSCATIGRAA